MANGNPLNRQLPPYKIFLRHHRAPGDVVVMTSAVESLHRQYPGQYRVCVSTPYPEIWKNNPGVEAMLPWTCHIVDLDYMARDSETGCHFMDAFTSRLGKALGVSLTRQVDRPCLFLTDEEKNKKWGFGKYIVLNAGVKHDMPAKQWGGYQSVVDRLKRRVKFVQVGLRQHSHPPLTGVVDLVGQTSLRDLFSLVNGSVGGIGGTTLLQHVCGALAKPYFGILGGREPVTWSAYPGAVLFGNVGSLPCCAERACWRSKVSGEGDRVCSLPVVTAAGIVPQCMESISVDEVVAAVNGLLGPANSHKRKNRTSGKTRPEECRPSAEN